MSAANVLLLQHGYLLLFCWVLIEQIGAPLPTVPLILTAGASTSTGMLDFTLCALAVTAGCVSADAITFFLGRRHGAKLVRFLCRMSLEPAACVVQAESAVWRYGPPALLVTKFVPGLNVMAAPISGQSKMPYARFFVFNEVRSNIPPELVALFERVKRGIKASPRMSRTEAFLHYAEENPDDVLAATEDKTEALIRELEGQYRQARRSLRRPTRPPRYTPEQLAEVPF